MECLTLNFSPFLGLIPDDGFTVRGLPPKLATLKAILKNGRKNKKETLN